MATNRVGLTHRQAGITLGLWGRRVTGVAVVLAGMLAIATWFVPTPWCWAAWIALGLLAGTVVGRGRDVWAVAVGAVAFIPLAAWLGLPTDQTVVFDRTHWLVVNAIGGVLVASGYVVGTLAWWRPGGADLGGRADTRPAGRKLVGAAIALGAVAFACWVGYSAVVGSEAMVTPAYKDMNKLCATPAAKPYGWSYDAINYDKADDANLPTPDANGDCTSQRTATAGNAVVSRDGTRLAGWYIPAARDVGADGPTIVVVPGWKSNKSEMLKYAEPLHADYNLVLMDTRYTGRSGGTQITWGVEERHDVHAMIDWLEREKHPSWIGSMGVSMGAASALADAVDDPRVRALILDSMHASVETSFADGLSSERRLPDYPTAWAMIKAATLRIGQDIETVYPTTTIRQLGDRPVLLLHGSMDTLDRPEHSADLVQAAAEAADVSIERHDCPTGGHGTVVDHCPDQWRAWANDFLGPLAATAR